jgi:hypothetical protein
MNKCRKCNKKLTGVVVGDWCLDCYNEWNKQKDDWKKKVKAKQ